MMKVSGRLNHSYTDGGHSNFPGAEYTPAEVEFMMTMDRYKRRVRRMPTAAEILDVARSLGYRRTSADPAAPPTPGE